MYKIEKGIAIPAISHTDAGTTIPNILARMEPGDSVLIERKQASYWLTVGRKRFQYKMVSRKLGAAKARVWRVE